MVRTLQGRSTGVGLALVVALLVSARELESATVAHEGFSSPALVDSILAGAGHTPIAMTRLQVESGMLMAGGIEVFVISRRSTLSGASTLYVNAVANFVAAGGNIVTEFSGATMFFSAYKAPLLTGANLTPQLGIFSGAIRSGQLLMNGAPIFLADPMHPVAAGLPNPFSEFGGTDNFFWMESADPDLHVIGFINGNGTAPFPVGMLPCLAGGCKGNSKFVFATWDWNDTLHMDGHNRRMFLNAVDYAVMPCNKAPTGDAGGPYLVECSGPGTSIPLDGTLSSDPDGDSLTYQWASDCPGFSLDDPASPTPVLTFDATGACSMQCTVTLTVSDGRESAMSSAMVSVQDLTAPDVAALVAPSGASQWERMVSFAAADACGMAMAAGYVDTGCSQVPVIDGQVIDMSSPEFWCDSSSQEAHAFLLVVTASDDCGNSTTTAFEWSETPPAPAAVFLRGDSDGDGLVTRQDLFHLLGFLFIDGLPPGCMDACDANDDGAVDLEDAITLVYFLKRGGFDLPLPYPEAGVDPTEDDLGCDLVAPTAEVAPLELKRAFSKSHGRGWAWGRDMGPGTGLCMGMLMGRHKGQEVEPGAAPEREHHH